MARLHVVGQGGSSTIHKDSGHAINAEASTKPRKLPFAPQQHVCLGVDSMLMKDYAYQKWPNRIKTPSYDRHPQTKACQQFQGSTLNSRT